MGRVAKKAPEAKAPVEESPIQTVTQTRAKRTPKPNPKYVNDSLVATPKIDISESNGSTDIEEKLPETKIVKSTKKTIASESATKPVVAAKTPVGKVKAGAIKKQKIEFDDDEKTKDADEVPLPSPTGRATRSGKTAIDKESEIKIGEDSVAIVDVSSIIEKEEVKEEESPKVTRGNAGRKRVAEATPVVEIKDDSPKKKKEEEKTSLITARKSYMPTNAAANKPKSPVIVGKQEVALKKEPVTAPKAEPVDVAKTLANNIKTRRSIVPQTPEIPDKKPKVEVKVSPQTTPVAAKPLVEPKKLPVINRKEPITPKVITPNATPVLANRAIVSPKSELVNTKPAPRVLNSMCTPKGAIGARSPNVKLAGDGTDKKVFSIEMSDGSVIEKKPMTIASPVKSPVKVAVKENIAINKPQPAAVLRNKLESELSRMKTSAQMIKRTVVPQTRNPALVAQAAASPVSNASPGTRRITKFESWYIIEIKDEPQAPLRHTHGFSLISLGNHVHDVQLPSTNWEHKVTLAKRTKKPTDDQEIYTGEINDKSADAERQNYEPICILFKRNHRDSNRVIIDRSIMFKPDTYTITMNGKQCHLLGAPTEITSLEDIEILLKIVDTTSLTHSCVETNC